MSKNERAANSSRMHAQNAREVNGNRTMEVKNLKLKSIACIPEDLRETLNLELHQVSSVVHG